MKINKIDNGIAFKQKYAIGTMELHIGEYREFLDILKASGKKDVEMVFPRINGKIDNHVLITTDNHTRELKEEIDPLYDIIDEKKQQKFIKIATDDFFKNAIKITEESFEVLKSVLKNDKM